VTVKRIPKNQNVVGISMLILHRTPWLTGEGREVARILYSQMILVMAFLKVKEL
jgi:hypothetical protein